MHLFQVRDPLLEFGRLPGKRRRLYDAPLAFERWTWDDDLREIFYVKRLHGRPSRRANEDSPHFRRLIDEPLQVLRQDAVGIGTEDDERRRCHCCHSVSSKECGLETGAPGSEDQLSSFQVLAIGLRPLIDEIDV